MDTHHSLNVLVKNAFSAKGDEGIFKGQRYIVIGDTVDMLDLLVMSGVFPSKSRARKNGWRELHEIKDGFNVFVVGKHKVAISIYKPVISNLDKFALKKYETKQWLTVARLSLKTWMQRLGEQLLTYPKRARRSLKKTWRTLIGH